MLWRPMLPALMNPPFVADIFLPPRNIVKIGMRLRNAPLPLNIVMKPAACLNIMVRPPTTSLMIGNMSKNAFFNPWAKSETPRIKSAIRFPNSTTSPSFAISSSLKSFIFATPDSFSAVNIGEKAFSRTRAPSISGRMYSTIFLQPLVKEPHQLPIRPKKPCVFGSHFSMTFTMNELTLSTPATSESMNVPVPKADVATISFLKSREMMLNIFCIATFAGSRNCCPKSAN